MSTPKPTNAERMRRDRRRQRDHDRAERHREHEERDADDVEQEERQPLHDPVGDVLERGGQAGRRRRPRRRPRSPPARRRCADGRRARSVASSCGAESGVTKTMATVFASLNCGSPADATPSRSLHAVVDPLRRLLVAVHVDDDRDRAVEARPEALGEQVVGPAGRLLVRLRALVGRARAARAPTSTRARGPRPSRTTNTTFACAVTNRPQRAIGVFSRAASESSIWRQERHLQPVDLVPELRQNRDAAASSRSAPWSGRRAREPMPSLVTKSRPKNARPVTEIATVRPAKSTARPADAPASAAASRGDSPSCRSWRKRVTMNSE